MKLRKRGFVAWDVVLKNYTHSGNVSGFIVYNTDSTVMFMYANLHPTPLPPSHPRKHVNYQQIAANGHTWMLMIT